MAGRVIRFDLHIGRASSRDSREAACSLTVGNANDIRLGLEWQTEDFPVAASVAGGAAVCKGVVTLPVGAYIRQHTSDSKQQAAGISRQQATMDTRHGNGQQHIAGTRVQFRPM